LPHGGAEPLRESPPVRPGGGFRPVPPSGRRRPASGGGGGRRPRLPSGAVRDVSGRLRHRRGGGRAGAPLGGGTAPGPLPGRGHGGPPAAVRGRPAGGVLRGEGLSAAPGRAPAGGGSGPAGGGRGLPDRPRAGRAGPLLAQRLPEGGGAALRRGA